METAGAPDGEIAQRDGKDHLREGVGESQSESGREREGEREREGGGERESAGGRHRQEETVVHQRETCGNSNRLRDITFGSEKGPKVLEDDTNASAKRATRASDSRDAGTLRWRNLF